MKKYLYFTISVLTFLVGMVFLFGFGDMEQSAISILTAIVFLNKCDIEELKERVR